MEAHSRRLPPAGVRFLGGHWPDLFFVPSTNVYVAPFVVVGGRGSPLTEVTS